MSSDGTFAVAVAEGPVLQLHFVGQGQKELAHLAGQRTQSAELLVKQAQVELPQFAEPLAERSSVDACSAIRATSSGLLLPSIGRLGVFRSSNALR